jgi:hypothetical protein
MTIPIVTICTTDKDQISVYVAGDEDVEGDFDGIFSYGLIDGKFVPYSEALGHAIEHANAVARELGGTVAIESDSP